jgi:short-chain Z-isoprenyl diphosphate synthase
VAGRRSEGRPGFLYGLYQARLRRQLTDAPLPHHIAMIIDGNRRWARERALETTAHGYRAGAAKMREFLGWCDELGVRVVTIYLLSADNLVRRPSVELEPLFQIIGDLATDLAAEGNWRIQHVGTTEGLPVDLVDQLREAAASTAEHSGLHINLAVGYGGRREIADAMRSIVRSHDNDGGTIDDLAEILTPELISEHLYTQGQPDPDLIIRTSGEQRLSDFMLWQSAHSEFYFVDALGPDLREVDFLRALRNYATRDRRYGQ